VNRTLAVSALIALILIGSFAYLYNRHVRKQEDAVAAFVLSEIDRKDKACRALYETEGCVRYPVSCAIPLEGCKERKTAAEQEWALKYPRQAAQRQADILAEKRKRDTTDMNKRQ
jgi:hypothetical protein